MLCGRDAGGDLLEQSAQGFAQVGYRSRNYRHRNHNHQHAVLHGGGIGVVLKEISALSHGYLHLGAHGYRLALRDVLLVLIIIWAIYEGR
jgi:hypothetical protein